jgi:5-methylcytosine-specific restriction endonuclease McrA
MSRADRLPKVCTVCARVVPPHQGWQCAEHRKVNKWSGRGPKRPDPGYSTAKWQRTRARILARDPYCTLQYTGCTGRSTQVDHVIPISEGGEMFPPDTGLRGACGHCNLAESNKRRKTR